MKVLRKAVILGIVTLMAAQTAHGAIITTLFASDNGGALGGAVYFDVTVAANPINITALEINIAETIAFSDLSVFVLDGQAGIGNETNGSPWVQVATGSGTGAGDDLVTAVTLSNSFVLGSGLHGMAIVAGAGTGHEYTNGTGGNQNYSNSDLSLSLGSATNVPFTGNVFNPRVFNGSIIYNVAAIPEPASALFGLGIVGLVALRRRRN